MSRAKLEGANILDICSKPLALARICKFLDLSEPVRIKRRVAQASGYRPNDRGDAALSMVNGFGADGVFKRR